MFGFVLTGHGGFEKLVWKEDLPLPQLRDGEVLIKVSACGLNNTDINTRIGWYSKTFQTETNEPSDDTSTLDKDASWGGNPLNFPRIQGADIVGIVHDAKIENPNQIIGKRVLVEPWIRREKNSDRFQVEGFIGSELDGGFAEFVKIPKSAAHEINSNLTDGELATFPTSSITAENMLDRARVQSGDIVLITGSSGGVGTALIQLSNRRGATTIAITSHAKAKELEKVNPNHVITPNEGDIGLQIMDLTDGVGVSVVADVVGGKNCTKLIGLLSRGGRFVCSGAIGGSFIHLDLRILYLNDLTMVGATVVPQNLFAKLVRYIELDEISPILAKTFPLRELHQAQEYFLNKTHIGNVIVKH